MTSFNNHHNVSNQAETQIVNGNIMYGLQDFDKAKDDQCLRDLRLTNPRDDKQRIEDTKDKLLQESFVWILDDADFKDWRDNQHTKLLWIKGDPGKGKTMLMIGLIDELSKQLESRPETETLAYFFCQGTDDRLRSATSVLRGLIYLLATKKRNLIRHIRKSYDVSGKLLFKDGNTWYALSTILQDILDDSSLARVYLMVDALDECDSNIFRLLDLIADSSSRSSKVKWLVSSRNKPDIEERLRMAHSPAKISLELNSYRISRAVNAFISSRVATLAKLKGYKDDLCEKIRKYLSAMAGGTFLWVALVCKTLETTRAGKTLSVLEKFPSGLQSVYTRMLQQIAKIEDKNDLESCRRILSSLQLTYRPIHLKELVSITGLNENPNDLETLIILVGLCGSFLTIREETVYFVHQTAKDYLTTSQNSHVLPLVQEEEHCGILARSLEAMSGTLRKDICNLRMPGVLLEGSKDLDLDPLAHVRYACSYWVDHLCQASKLPQHKTGLSDNGPIHAFLKIHFLHWLEALSLMGMISTGVVMVKRLETLLMVIKADVGSLVAMAQDAKRFVLYHRFIIETAPLQVYASALAFSPRKSVIRNLFWSQGPNWIERYPGVREIWNQLVQTLEGHEDKVNGVTFSPNGKWVASTSDDKTIRIWDAETGALQKTLGGHIERPLTVIFSPNGQRLASASSDGKVRLWDTETGVLEQTLEGRTYEPHALSFSPSGQWLYLTSTWTTNRWDTETGALQQSFETYCARDTIFSANGQWILFTTRKDQKTQLWDAETGVLKRTLEGHRGAINPIAFSYNSQWLASASIDGRIQLWNAETGALQKILKIEGEWDKLIFSPNGEWLASVSNQVRWLPSTTKSILRDKAVVRLWDVETGILRQTLEGHAGLVNAVAFSPNSHWLASVSADDSIELWDLDGDPQQTLEGNKERIRDMTFSPSGQILASTSNDATILWDAETGALKHALEGRRGCFDSLTFSPNGKFIAGTSYLMSLGLWDTETGTLRYILDDPKRGFGVIAFSPNGLWLALASGYGTIKLYDAETGHLQQRLKDQSSRIRAMAFSPNGQCLASASDNTIRVLDAETRDLQQKLEAKGNRGRLNDLTLSINNRWHANMCGDIKLPQTYEGHIAFVTDLTFSPNNQWIASISDDRAIRLWDVKTGALQQTLQGLKLGKIIKFSLDGRYLITNFGFIELPTSHSNSIQPINYGLHYDEENPNWIMWKNHRLLWLPPEYRPDCQAFHENAFAISRSGQVTIIRFKKNVSPIS